MCLGLFHLLDRPRMTAAVSLEGNGDYEIIKRDSSADVVLLSIVRSMKDTQGRIIMVTSANA